MNNKHSFPETLFYFMKIKDIVQVFKEKYQKKSERVRKTLVQSSTPASLSKSEAQPDRQKNQSISLIWWISFSKILTECIPSMLTEADDESETNTLASCLFAVLHRIIWESQYLFNVSLIQYRERGPDDFSLA